MHLTPRTFALPALFAALALQASAAVYNPTTEFSITNGNPNGVWSYGYSDDPDLADLSANFTPMPDATGPNFFGIAWSAFGDRHVALNTSSATQFGVPPGMLTQHPGPLNQASLLRFTAPEAATADIVGEYLAGDPGAMLLAVLVNGTAVWTATDAGSFDLDATLTAGSTVDFAVYGGYVAGNTPLAVTITTTPTAVPEPSSFAAFAGLATLGLAAIRRRRA